MDIDSKQLVYVPLSITLTEEATSELRQEGPAATDASTSFTSSKGHPRAAGAGGTLAGRAALRGGSSAAQAAGAQGGSSAGVLQASSKPNILGMQAPAQGLGQGVTGSAAHSPAVGGAVPMSGVEGADTSAAALASPNDVVMGPVEALRASSLQQTGSGSRGRAAEAAAGAGAAGGASLVAGGVTTSGQQQSLQVVQRRHVVERIAPCLLPEQPKVEHVAVKGPRYWPQVLGRHSAGPLAAPAPAAPTAGCFSVQQPAAASTPAAASPVANLVMGTVGGHSHAGSHSGASSSLARLYQQQLVFVKKKAGSLSYSHDPTGIRSLLSRAFHAQHAAVVPLSQLQPSQGDEAGLDAGAASSAQPVTAGAANDPGQDMVHLCATFSADPFIMAFAQCVQQLARLQAALATSAGSGAEGEQIWAGRSTSSLQPRLLMPSSRAPARESASSAQQGHPSYGFHAATEVAPCPIPVDTSGLLAFAKAALFECVSGEKPALVAAYMQQYCLVHLYSRKLTWACQPTAPALDAQACMGTASEEGSVSLHTLGLRSLRLARAAYASPTAAACATVADAAAGRSSGNSKGPAGMPASGPISAAEQQAWQPLMQPMLLEGLWVLVLESWHRAGLLPSGPASSVGAGKAGPGALQDYLRTGLLQTQGSQQQPGGAKQRLLQNALAMCLCLTGFPMGCEMHAAISALQSTPLWPQLQQAAAMSRSAGAALLPLLAALLPGVPRDALGMVAAELLAANTITG